MLPRPNRAVVAAIGVVVFLVVGFLWRVHLREPGPEPPALHPAATRMVLGWHLDEARSYDLRIASRVQFGLFHEEPGESLEQQLVATLHLHVLGVGPDGIETGCQLGDATLSQGGVVDPAVDARLRLPFRSTWSPDGHLLVVRVSSELQPAEGAIVEESLRTFQTVVPAGAGLVWSTVEENGSGIYEARYGILPGENLLKTKTGFRDGPKGVRVTVRRSEARCVLASGGTWIDACELEEELEVEASGSTVRARTLATLRLRDEVRATPEIFAPAFAYEELVEREALVANDEENAATEPTIPLGPEVREAYAAWIAHLDEGEGTDPTAMRALAELFQRCPEATALVPDTLLEPGHPKRTRGALLHALELASTPEAQAALGSVVENPLQDHGDRVGALVAVGGLTGAEGSTVDFLWRTAAQRGGVQERDLANTASLSLGCLARTLKETDPDAYGHLRDSLVIALQGSYDAQERSVFLKSLGNTGDPMLVEAAAVHLQDDTASVRAAAAWALGSMDSERSLVVLRECLATEKRGSVRGALASGLDSLSHTDSETLGLVDRMVREEEDENARYSMACYLATRLSAHPAGEATLRALLAGDRSDRIRRFVSDQLLEHEAGNSER